MITKAKTAGFCGGVKIAIEKATLKPIGKRCVLGSLVHNKAVIERIKKQGIEFVDDLDSSFDEVVISAHGISKDLKEKLEKYKVIDATCIRVQRLIELAKKVDENECFVMVGDSNHSEVKNVISYAKNAFILSKTHVQKETICELLSKPFEKFIVVFQTTVSKEVYENYCRVFETLSDSRIFVYDTLCPFVQMRIDDGIELAKQSELMIVVGDKKSANSKLLFEECKKVNSNTIFIESEKELPFAFPEKIGITSGASTDLADVDKIIEFIESTVK